jgi:hypothetical protein
VAHEAIDADRPGYLRDVLGPVPASTRGKRAWRHGAAAVTEYRAVWGITDPDQALGPQPHDPAQRADWQRARAAVERVHHKQRVADRARQHQPTREQQATGEHQATHQQHRPARPHERDARSGRQGPERAAG